jgi:cysteinyl-tRNA synthetase
MRPFVPVEPGTAKMYVCGVTPYDVTHLGHAFSYVQFDTIRRYLGWRGYEVRYVQNVTDIDDDMIMVSKREGGRPIAEIRDENDAILRRDLDALNVLRPHAYPFATDYIPQIIETTQRIIAAGRAYEVDGDVFFEVATMPTYGALNGLTLEALAKRENPESKREEKKRGHLDFLLWQRTEEGEPCWQSPWGLGRPGWSIECTAMSMTLLGNRIDIHGGGSDLKYPHHENEIAQAETACGETPFCGFWMHNGMLQLEGVKMSKSLGNLVLARNLLKDVEGDHLRLYLLSNHYRTDANYEGDALDRLKERFDRLRTATLAADAATQVDGLHPVLQAFESAMDNDIDAPAALDVLDRAAGRVLDGTSGEDEADALRMAASVLGFSFAGARGPANGDLTP